MSWFDAAGIASLAKNALKEAQKTIDKALDITEDEDADTAISSPQTAESLAQSEPPNKKDPSKSMKQSISNPVLSSEGAPNANNVWGSFAGSFFDAKSNSDDVNKPAVTVAPTSSSGARGIARLSDEGPSSANVSERVSSASASDSVELLSSPISSISDLNSPSTSKSLTFPRLRMIF